MEYRTDAYELQERPELTRHIKVITPNKLEAVMEYRQLLDKEGNLLPNVEKIEYGYYRIK
jgi:hypothetical protein